MSMPAIDVEDRQDSEIVISGSSVVKPDFSSPEYVHQFLKLMPVVSLDQEELWDLDRKGKEFKAKFERFWAQKTAELTEKKAKIPSFTFATAQILIIVRCVKEDLSNDAIEYYINKYTLDNNLCMPPLKIETSASQYVNRVKKWAVNIWNAHLAYLNAGGSTSTERQTYSNTAQAKRLEDLEKAFKSDFKRCGFSKSRVLQQEVIEVGRQLYARDHQTKEEKRAAKENRRRQHQVQRREEKALYGQALMDIAEGTSGKSTLQNIRSQSPEAKILALDGSNVSDEVVDLDDSMDADAGSGQKPVASVGTECSGAATISVPNQTPSHARRRLVEEMDNPPASSSKKKRREHIPIGGTGDERSDALSRILKNGRQGQISLLMNSFAEQQQNSTKEFFQVLNKQNELSEARTARLIADMSSANAANVHFMAQAMTQAISGLAQVFQKATKD